RYVWLASPRFVGTVVASTAEQAIAAISPFNRPTRTHKCTGSAWNKTRELTRIVGRFGDRSDSSGQSPSLFLFLDRWTRSNGPLAAPPLATVRLARLIVVYFNYSPHYDAVQRAHTLHSLSTRTLLMPVMS